VGAPVTVGAPTVVGSRHFVHSLSECQQNGGLVLVLRSVITVFCLLFLALIPASPGTAQALPETRLVLSASTPRLPEPSGIGVRLLDIPAATQNDPRARSYIVDRLAPGIDIRRRIQVQNNSNSAQSVRIYPGAATIKDGSFVGGNDPAVNELTTWTSIDQPQLRMVAGEKADVLVTINVPADAPEGEQYGVVWAEVRSAPAEGANIVQASRAGIRIYLSVGPGNGKPADFNITSLTAARDAQGKPRITASVINTGGRALDITGDLRLSEGPGGLSAGPFALQQATTLAPGSSGSIAFTLDPKLPNGPWNAQLRLKSGLVEHETAATITFPDAGQGETVKPVAESNLLWIALGAGAGVLLLAAALLWRMRRRNVIKNSPN